MLYPLAWPFIVCLYWTRNTEGWPEVRACPSYIIMLAFCARFIWILPTFPRTSIQTAHRRPSLSEVYDEYARECKKIILNVLGRDRSGSVGRGIAGGTAVALARLLVPC